MSLGVYLHIPYCRSRCRYCDFYSQGGSSAVPDDYVDALLRCLGGWQRHAGWQRPATVYFGGGTPSLLSPAQAARLLEALQPLPQAEVTLEANPGTVGLEELQGFRAAGINRLSVGVQTADDASLKRLGRAHTAADSRRILRQAAAAGFSNVSGDVMLALPQYTAAELGRTLELLEQGGVTHISSYLLKLEPGTPFGRTPPPGLPDEDAAAGFYLACVEECTRRGYTQYEISNFARPGRESRHNLRYWNCEDYLGIGPGAHSCLGGRRFFYPPDFAAFLRGDPPQEEGDCTAEDYIMLQLRLNAGLSLSALAGRWDRRFSPQQLAFLSLCERQGLARCSGDAVALTPQGMLVQNSILCRLI